MQNLDNQIAFRYGRSLFSFFRKGLQSVAVPGKESPTYIPEAVTVTKALARHSDGEPLDMITNSVLNAPVTAHILGGCCIAASKENGVVDTEGQVFGYPGLYVADASAIPANVGVNPSLTITAMAERFMNLMPSKNDN